MFELIIFLLNIPIVFVGYYLYNFDNCDLCNSIKYWFYVHSIIILIYSIIPLIHLYIYNVIPDKLIGLASVSFIINIFWVIYGTYLIYSYYFFYNMKDDLIFVIFYLISLIFITILFKFKLIKFIIDL